MSEMADGLYFDLPSDNAPEFVKGKLSLDLNRFVAWARENHTDGKIKIDILVAKSGKPYGKLNTWKPNPDQNWQQQGQGGHNAQGAINHAPKQQGGQQSFESYTPPTKPAGVDTYQDEIPF